jgi:hypothetical protein
MHALDALEVFLMSTPSPTAAKTGALSRVLFMSSAMENIGTLQLLW